MKINQAKTKVMLFNQSRTIDVLPALVINEDTHLETVDEIKLFLGVIVRNGMKWHSNTRQIISKYKTKVICADLLDFILKRLGDFFCPERLGDFFCPQSSGDFIFVLRGWVIFF